METDVGTTDGGAAAGVRGRGVVDIARTFRDVNDRVDALRQSAATLREYLCECADLGCLERIELTRAQYRDVRRHENGFLVVPGHVDAADRVVTRHPAFAVIETAG